MGLDMHGMDGIGIGGGVGCRAAVPGAPGCAGRGAGHVGSRPRRGGRGGSELVSELLYP